jgi:hypothetical protein
VDIEQTTEQQLLAEAKKQTAAQESMRTMALVWSVVAVLAFVTWLFVTVAAGR